MSNFQFMDGRNTYAYDDNKMAGLHQAVRNGQTRLAMDYSFFVLQEITAGIAELKDEVSSLRELVKSVSVEPKPVRSSRQKEKEDVGRNDQL